MYFLSRRKKSCFWTLYKPSIRPEGARPIILVTHLSYRTRFDYHLKFFPPKSY